MAEQKSFKELLAHIVEYGKNEQMEELADVFEDIMEMLKMNHPEMYAKYYKQVEEIMGSDHLTEEEAKHYVMNLTHKDGTKGEYFTMERVEDLMRRNPELAKYDKNDVYYVINMLHSDFYKPKWDVDTYVMFTAMWMDDPDGCADKAKRHAMIFHP